MAEPANVAHAASEILMWLRERAPWRSTVTPVDALAAALGLDVALFDPTLHPGVWGFLEPGENLIFLRAGLSAAARRFTLAHEIGHAVLHREPGVAEAGFARRPGVYTVDSAELLATCLGSDVEPHGLLDDETLGPGQAYSARAVVEQEANAFATELLMPETSFLETYLALASRIDGGVRSDGVTRRLARRFGVSEDATLQRLQRLLAPMEGALARDEGSGTDIGAVDQDQRAAVRLETPALVMAGPGSGKTSTLAARAIYLVTEAGVKPEEILALTFSRKAAVELSRRASRFLARSGVDQSLAISTIHRFCLDLLRRHGHLVGLVPEFRLATEIESYFLLRQALREGQFTHLSSASTPDAHVRDIQQAISRAKDDLIAPEDAAAEALRMLALAGDDAQRDAAASRGELAAIYHFYQERLALQGAVDFGDIIRHSVTLLRADADVVAETRHRWPHILVDEYQDINRAMGAFLRELAPDGIGLWAVGDVDQAIYRFRGAEPEIMSQFSVTFPNARMVTLARNYRSRKQILDVSRAFAGQLPYPVDRLPFQAIRDESFESSPAVTIAAAATDSDELDGLAAAIAARRASGRHLRDQVVLMRTRRQVEVVARGLSERGLATRIQRGALDSDIVKQVVAVVGLLCEPSGAGLIRAGFEATHAFSRQDAIALLHAARLMRKTPLAAMHSHVAIEDVSPAGSSAMRRLGRVLARLRSARTVSAGLSLYSFSLTGMGARLLEAERRGGPEATALKRLLDLARDYDAWIAPLQVPEGAPGPVDWAGFMDYLNVAADLRLDGLGDLVNARDDEVNVMTAHASKGLEFPVVYLPQLVNRRFPLLGRTSPVPSLRAQADAEGDGALISDEASLFYVAMTRARDELTLSYARRYGRAAYTISPFLTAIEGSVGDDIVHDEWAPKERIVEAPVRESEDEYPSEGVVSGTLSLGELETYQRCPRQYAYRYVDAIWAPAPLVSLFGRVSRQLERHLAQVMWEGASDGGAGLTLDAAHEFAEARWQSTLEHERLAMTDTATGEHSTAIYYARRLHALVDRVWARLNRGQAGDSQAASAPGGTQAYDVTVQLGALAIHGEVDVDVGVAERAALQSPPRAGQGGASVLEGRPATVVRYRFGRSDSAPDLRDLFAVMAAEDMSRDSGGVNVVRLGLNGAPRSPVKLSARQRARLSQDALTAAAGIHRGDFPTKPDEWQCRRCPFAASCPE